MYDQQGVASLEIGPDYQTGTLEPNAEFAAVVVAGSLAAIDASVSAQHRQDLLQTLLLAQLAANAKADRHTDPSNWYKIYQQTLESVGWVVSASVALSRFFPPTSSRYTMKDVVVDLFKRKVTGDELALISNALTSYRNDTLGRGQYVFECPSHGGGNGNFQVVLATEDDEALTVHVGRFAFTVPAYVGKIAQHEFSAEARFQSGYLSMALNEEAFAKLRSAVTDKLGDRLAVSIAQLT